MQFLAKTSHSRLVCLRYLASNNGALINKVSAILFESKSNRIELNLTMKLVDLN